MEGLNYEGCVKYKDNQYSVFLTILDKEDSHLNLSVMHEGRVLLKRSISDKGRYVNHLKQAIKDAHDIVTSRHLLELEVFMSPLKDKQGNRLHEPEDEFIPLIKKFNSTDSFLNYTYVE